MRRARTALLAFALSIACSVASVAGIERQREAEEASQRGDHRAAARLYEAEAAESEKAHGEKDPRTLGHRFELANEYAHLGRLPEAIALHERVLALRVEVLQANHPDILDSMRSLARALSRSGRQGEALPYAERALATSRAQHGARSIEVASAAQTLGNLYWDLGRLGQALPLVEEAAKLRAEIQFPGHPDALIAEANLALLYRELGLLDRSLALELGILNQWIRTRGEKSPEAIIALGNLAGTYTALGRQREALELFERCFNLSAQVHGERAPQTLLAMLNLSRAYRSAGRHGEAMPLAEKLAALSVEVLGERHPQTLDGLAALAEDYDRARRPAQALSLRERVYAQRQSILGQQHPGTLSAAGDLAFAYAALRRFDDAARLAGSYVAGVEAYRMQPGLTAEQRQAFFAGHARHYRMFAHILGFLGRGNEGFRIAELSKARTLLEGMAERRAGRFGLPAGEKMALEALERQAGALDPSAAPPEDPEAARRMQSLRNEVARQAEALRARLKREYPKFAQMSDVKPLDAAGLKGLVPADAIAVSYIVHMDGTAALLHAWIMDSEGAVRFHNLGVIGFLDGLLDAARRAVGMPNGLKTYEAELGLRVWRLPDDGGYRVLHRSVAQPQSWVAVSELAEVHRYLARRLLDPLEPTLRGKRRWIISPDGLLAQLPFEVLPWGARGEPAAASIDVQYTQSLSVLALGVARREQYASLKDRRALFAMGNPVYRASGSPPGDRSGVRAIAVRSATQLRELDLLWENLPGTEREVRGVIALFGADGRALLGAQATEYNLQRLNALGELAKYRYLLFSTHGYVSHVAPALSSIVLGLVNRAPGTDGYVTAAEWPDYDLRSDLLVLSACDTGLGQRITGEGVMGLPYALFVAGNVNTILTLWPVDDDATAAFVKSLFARLKAGAQPAAALAETKREFLLHPVKRYSDPSVWAPFILVGPG